MQKGDDIVTTFVSGCFMMVIFGSILICTLAVLL